MRTLLPITIGTERRAPKILDSLRVETVIYKHIWTVHAGQKNDIRALKIPEVKKCSEDAR